MLKKEVKQAMEQAKVIYEYDRVAHGLNELQASLKQLEATLNMNHMQRRYLDPDLVYRRVRVEKQRLPTLVFPLSLLAASLTLAMSKFDACVARWVQTVGARW